MIAALVTYYARATSFWQPAPANGNSDAALAFEAEIRGLSIHTDEQWRVQRSAAWSLASGGDPLTGGIPVELFDARLLDPRCFRSGFDDTAWDDVAVVSREHMGADGETRPPSYPFGRLLPRGISHLEGGIVLPTAVIEASDRHIESWSSDHPVERVKDVLAQAIEKTAPTELPATCVVGEGTVRHIELDFGRIVAGVVEIDMAAPPGTYVELHYREKRFQPGREAPADPVTGARFVTTSGVTRYSGCEINGLRFAHMVVHAGRPVEATVARVAVRECLYPRRGSAYFRCNDALLNRLYEVGVRTVQLSSFDAYIDCPTREQRSWTGDAIVHQLVDLVTNEDWGLARNYIDLGHATRPDGILPMASVGDLAVGLTIPDWSLSWAHGVYTQFQYDGDVNRALHAMPVVQRILEWYAAYIDENGTLAEIPEWNLVDWSSIFHSGRASIITALWARSLQEFADISEALGNGGSAAWAMRLHAAAAVGFEDFWDARRGLYVDHLVSGGGIRSTSQVANAAAIVSGLVPRARWNEIIERITAPERLVNRSVGSEETGSYDREKMLERRRGSCQIDWDVSREIVVAQPFFSYVVHDAIAQAGRADILPDLLPRWERLLNGDYDTFGEGWGWGTPVHGWSSTPARDLVVYVLGIAPDLPGYERVRIQPRPGRLTELAGSVPTAFGPVEVVVSGSMARLRSPVPVRFVKADGSACELAPGSHEVGIA